MLTACIDMKNYCKAWETSKFESLLYLWLTLYFYLSPKFANPMSTNCLTGALHSGV